jgi:hypothetical protein
MGGSTICMGKLSRKLYTLRATTRPVSIIVNNALIDWRGQLTRTGNDTNSAAKPLSVMKKKSWEGRAQKQSL